MADLTASFLEESRDLVLAQAALLPSFTKGGEDLVKGLLVVVSRTIQIGGDDVTSMRGEILTPPRASWASFRSSSGVSVIWMLIA